MNTKYKALYKYELKKLLWFYFALFIFLILYGTMHKNAVSYEIGGILSLRDIYSINYRLLEPGFYFFYSAIVFILIYLQFNDGFNKLWHSLPFTNKDVIAVKLITGVLTILVFTLAVGIIMLCQFYSSADIYKDTLLTLNIDPSAIAPGFIILTMFTIFLVYVFIYFFTVLIQYFVGSCISGVCLSVLLLHLPVLTFAAFNFVEIRAAKIMFAVFPHYFCIDNNFFYNYIEFQGGHIYTGLFDKFGIGAVIYYFILSAIALLILSKVSVSPKWTEQSSPFTKRWTEIIFKLAFLADFFLAGLTVMFSGSNTAAKLLVSIVFGAIGFIISYVIVKRQGVSQ